MNKFPQVTLKTEEPNISDIVHTIYLRDIVSYVLCKHDGEPDTEENCKRIAAEAESIKQHFILKGYEIRL